MTSPLTSATASSDDRTRRSAARVPLEVPNDLFSRAMVWYSRRTYGDVLDTGLALLHNQPVLRALVGYERRVEKWSALDPDLKVLAEMASAGMIGCSWCVDFGWYQAHSRGLDVTKLEEVPAWRDSEVFTELERLVLEYAEAMTATPPTVTDELAEQLRGALGNAAFVELTTMVALENHRSRINSALGLTSQGFKERCELDR